VTSFLMPPAIWDVLQDRRERVAADGGGAEQVIEAGKRRFAGNFTPLVTSEITSDPFRPTTGGDDKS
jgi:hypothetical protein